MLLVQITLILLTPRTTDVDELVAYNIISVMDGSGSCHVQTIYVEYWEADGK